MVDIPESLPGVPDVSCVSCRDMPLPSPSVSGSDAPPSRSDTPTYASSWVNDLGITRDDNYQQVEKHTMKQQRVKIEGDEGGEPNVALVEVPPDGG
jgi:hypothetical protein